MSRIYFASPSGEIELRGSERAHMGVTIDDIWKSLIKPFWDTDNNPSPLRRLIRNAPPIATGPRKYGDFDDEAYWRPTSFLGERYFSLPSGETVDFFSAALNTAMLFGPIMTMLAWLHGTCEIHAYAEGEDRSALADIIDQGRKSEIMRAGMGWEEVASFLREGNDEPVVTSYSVTEGFPNMDIAGWQWDRRNQTRWEKLTDEQRWDKAMKGLRKGKFGPRMIFNGSWFGPGTSQAWHAFNLTALADSLEE